MLRPILIAALAPLATPPAPAPAQTTETRSIAVPYGDLALQTASGRARLDRRIAVAVQRVCGHADPRDFAQASAIRKCRTIAQADTQSRVAALTGTDRNAEFAAATTR